MGGVGLGWRRILCHVAVRCGSRAAVVSVAGCAAMGVLGVYWCWSPWSGCALSVN